MISIKKIDGRWNVYDDGHLIVSYYSQDAAEATKCLILDEREYERIRKDERDEAYTREINRPI